MVSYDIRCSTVLSVARTTASTTVSREPFIAYDAFDCKRLGACYLWTPLSDKKQSVRKCGTPKTAKQYQVEWYHLQGRYA